jgi:hypothetical protein
MSERAKDIIAKNLIDIRNPDRWMAEISYLDGTATKVITFEELEHLDEIVERGPDWNTIDKIVVTLNRPSVAPKRRSDF